MARPKRVRKTKRKRVTTPKSLRSKRDEPQVDKSLEEEIIEKQGNDITKQIRMKAKFKVDLPKLKKVRKKKHPTDVFKIKNWKSTIIDMSSKGASNKEVLAVLGLTKRMHDKLIQMAKEENPDEKTLKYAEICERAGELCEAWWTQTGREGLTLGKGFNSHLYFMNMKNRFGWGDNMKVDLGEETIVALQESIVNIAKGGTKQVDPIKKKKKVAELDI